MTTQPGTEVSTPSDLEIRFRRTFAAPPQLVADAFTTPELLQRWMGLNFGDWAWASCDIDLRAGGAYRWVWRNAVDGSEMAISGTYLEVVPGERYVATQRYESMPEYPGEMTTTLIFTEDEGQTLMEETVRYASQAERDRDLEHAPSGLEPGYVALDAVLAAEVRAGR
ncbi:MAG: ATPase [Chloroflexi bacterium]|nr:SRPBCC domain-containing protein [Chloroflexota bacterium]MDA1240591.1 SRPBCC domain-containing protein [Chloroflexota bacterium]MQC18948.1 ATPase [Chloroflexota bacterium]